MRRIAVLLTLAVIVLLLGIAQLVLPGIAEQRLRDRLSKSGTVLKVEVDAFPAIQLLWHHADKVIVRLGRYRSSSSHLGSLLGQAGGVSTVDASAQQLDTGLLTLEDATLRKRGDTFTGSARITQQNLRAAVPFLDAVEPVASGNGQLILRGTATLLGVTASVDATVAASNGRLIVQPDVPFGALATVTLFSDPHVSVTAVGASAVPGGFQVSAVGRVR